MSRFAAFTDLQSRDGTLDRGGRVINGYVEGVNDRFYVQKRPSLDLLNATLTGVGGGLWTDPSGTLGSVGMNGSGTVSTFFQLQAASGSSVWSSVLATSAVGLAGRAASTVVVVIGDTDYLVYNKSSVLSTSPSPVGWTLVSTGNFVYNDFYGTNNSAFNGVPLRTNYHGTALWMLQKDGGGFFGQSAYSLNNGATWEESFLKGSQKSISLLSYGAGTATAVSTSHGLLGSFGYAVVTGTSEPEFDGTRTFNVIDSDTFKYPMGAGSGTSTTSHFVRWLQPIAGPTAVSEGIVSHGSVVRVYTGDTVVSSSTPTDWQSWIAQALTGIAAGLTNRGMAATSTTVYSLGGLSGGTPSANVYSSSNGVDFTLVTGSPGWSARYNVRAVCIGSNLYAFGGQTSAGVFKHDVWKSTDGGATWTDISPSLAVTNFGLMIGATADSKPIFYYDDGDNPTYYIYEAAETAGTGFFQASVGTLSNPNGVIASFASTP